MVRIILLMSFTLVLLSACTYEEVEKEAKEYCACKNREFRDLAGPGECAKMLQRLKNKYEYRPEHQEKLALEIATCMAMD